MPRRKSAQGGLLEHLAPCLQPQESGTRTPAPEVVKSAGDASVGVLTLGGCRGAILEAIELLEAEGIYLDFIRVRGFPFNAQVTDFINDHDITLVVEQNRDGQLRKILLNETAVTKDKLSSLRVYDGMPLSAQEVIDGVHALLAEAEVG